MNHIEYVYAEGAERIIGGETGLIVVGSNAVAQDLASKLPEWDVVSATTITDKQRDKYEELFGMHKKILFWMPEDSYKDWKAKRSRVTSAIVHKLPNETQITLIIAAPCPVEKMVEVCKCIFKPRLTATTLADLHTDSRQEYRYSRKLRASVSVPVPFVVDSEENLIKLRALINS